MAIKSLEELTIPEGLSKRGASEPSQELDRSTFMQLLVAELKNQDPLDPLQAREMVTQLSQLTSVERLSSIEEGISSMTAETAGLASTQVSSLVGRQVTANANSLMLDELGTVNGAFNLARAASSVEIGIRNQAGELVRTLALGETPAGSKAFVWDGANADGIRATPGRYRVSVTARDEQGNAIASDTNVSGRVTEVHYDSGIPELMVGETKVRFDDVTSIAQ